MSNYKTIFLLIDVEKYEYSTVNVYNVAISFFLFISMLRDTISWVRHDQEILYILSLALFLSAKQLCKITAGLRIHVFFYTDQTFCFDKSRFRSCFCSFKFKIFSFVEFEEKLLKINLPIFLII